MIYADVCSKMTGDQERRKGTPSKGWFMGERLAV
jgi:hypothetical protein